ncbi:SDR family NAD(P)-dependent oxidoreductase [Terracidiphilus gabretensis]|uniref:SDR family NAD(P)-dependent oxidoreductase n=1 Tax=Terracidiphilus gabretensis TaxID=1577687 RepID=UPI00071BA067|nr:glucose 1-dehydrogenase [Terracidiphilus gabretensis]
MRRLEGKIAIITGAGSGIGQAIAKRLGSEGARVVIDYVGSAEGAQETKRAICESGGDAEIVQADITQRADVDKLIDTAWSRFGSANILVNNAGMEHKSNFWETAEEEYDKVLAVNLRGPFFLTQRFVQRLIDVQYRGGRIINISSVHEDMAFPGFSTYCCSKGGLRMLMRNLAVELAPLGFTINNVAPGAIVTPINKTLLEDKPKLDALLKNIPLGRLGTTEDVAAVVAFLASDEAAYVNGATYTVDGGLIRNYHEQ